MTMRARPAPVLQRAEHAELVVLRVGQHDPRHVGGLSDRRPRRAESDQALDLGVLVLEAQVEMEPVLSGGRVRHAQEQQVRYDAVLSAARRRLQDDLLAGVMGAAPAEGRLPEGGASSPGIPAGSRKDPVETTGR
jgi:hypothetical protein